jgi:phosphoglycolate phosphatase-like HAD superfamily hydrolase
VAHLDDPDNWRWRDGRVDPGSAVVFDMDGVLSDAAGRQHYLEWPYRDWEAFFEACGDDELIAEVAACSTSHDDLHVVLLTARPMRAASDPRG